MSTRSPETLLPLAQKATQLLAERGIENARLESELLLAHVLGIKRLDLYLQFDRPLTEAQLEQFRAVIRRRLKREPLQYITGHVQFRNLELTVDGRVLIPRPETEVLAGVVIDWANAQNRPLRAIDIGTGSGAIALSLAKECPNVSVLATDLSREATEVAKANAEAAGLELEVRVGDLWDAVPADAKFDIVVSNPPYVKEAERDTLQPEVRDWEPANALFAGADGLDVIRTLSRSHAHMLGSGLLALEIGADQAAEVKAILDATASYENIQVLRDLAGRDRIVTAGCRSQEA